MGKEVASELCWSFVWLMPLKITFSASDSDRMVLTTAAKLNSLKTSVLHVVTL